MAVWAEIDWEATGKLLLALLGTGGISAILAGWWAYRLKSREQTTEADANADKRRAKFRKDDEDRQARYSREEREQLAKARAELIAEYQEQGQRRETVLEEEREVNAVLVQKLNECEQRSAALTMCCQFLDEERQRMYAALQKGGLAGPEPIRPMPVIPEPQHLDLGFLRRQTDQDRTNVKEIDKVLKEKADSIGVKSTKAGGPPGGEP